MEHSSEFRPVAKDKSSDVYFSYGTATSFISLRGKRSKGKGEKESRSEKRDRMEREWISLKHAVFLSLHPLINYAKPRIV